MNLDNMTAVILSVSLAIVILGTAFYIPYYGDAARPNGYNETYEDLVSYLNGPYFSGDQELITDFTEREQSHLSDVKSVLDRLNIIFYAAILLVIACATFLYEKEETLRNALAGGGFTALGFMIILGLLVIIDFQFFWNKVFHPLLFPQGNWMFPADSLLIQMFPAEVFKKFAYRMIAYAVVFSSIIAGTKMIRK